MASKNDKTSKTARVMNLLSKKPDPAVEEAPEASVPPIVSSMMPDAAVSAQIKNALEDTLEDELGAVQEEPAPAPQPEPEPVQLTAPAPQPEPEPVQLTAPAPQPKPEPVQLTAPAPQPEPEPVQQAAPEPQPEPEPVQQDAPAPQPEPEPVQQDAPAPQPEPEPVQQAVPAPQPEPEPVQQAAPAPQPEPEPVQQDAPAPQPEPAPDPVQEEPDPLPVLPEPEDPPEVRFQEPLQPLNPGYINVMQVLVEEKAPKYTKMFGLCTCDRCMEDVKALTLNNLPSKYVVLEPGDRIPRLTVYEGRFASDITAQMLKACKLVMAHPHHGR